MTGALADSPELAALVRSHEKAASSLKDRSIGCKHRRSSTCVVKKALSKCPVLNGRRRAILTKMMAICQNMAPIFKASADGSTAAQQVVVDKDAQRTERTLASSAHVSQKRTQQRDVGDMRSRSILGNNPGVANNASSAATGDRDELLMDATNWTRDGQDDEGPVSALPRSDP